MKEVTNSFWPVNKIFWKTFILSVNELWIRKRKSLLSLTSRTRAPHPWKRCEYFPLLHFLLAIILPMVLVLVTFQWKWCWTIQAHSYPCHCPGHGFLHLVVSPLSTITTTRVFSPVWDHLPLLCGLNQLEISHSKATPRCQDWALFLKVGKLTTTKIRFLRYMLFTNIRMIELDGRSLMNRKKEAALLDMVAKHKNHKNHKNTF